MRVPRRLRDRFDRVPVVDDEERESSDGDTDQDERGSSREGCCRSGESAGGP